MIQVEEFKTLNDIKKVKNYWENCWKK